MSLGALIGFFQHEVQVLDSSYAALVYWLIMPHFQCGEEGSIPLCCTKVLDFELRMKKVRKSIASMAQLVEQLAFNQWGSRKTVEGSNPSGCTN